MNLQSVCKRSRCCMLLGRTKLTQKITGVCTEDVLLKNLETIQNRGACESISSLSDDMQVEILQAEENLQYLLNLLDLGISDSQIKCVLGQMPVKELMKFTPVEVQGALSHPQVADNFLGVYLKYYMKEGLTGEELSNLWKGLEWFRGMRTELADDWLGSIGAEKTLFMEPAIARNFIGQIQDYDSCIQMLAQRKDVRHLLNALCQAYDGEAVLDEVAMEEICAGTKRLSGLWGWVQGFFGEQQLVKFLKIWLRNHELVYDLECLKKRAESGEEIDREAILAGRASYIAFCYDEEFAADIDTAHEELIIYAITHKKKAFLSLVRRNIQLYKSISQRSVLFSRNFYDKCLNINSLSIRNLAACKEMEDNEKTAWKLLVEREHTFEEFSLIYALPGEYIQLYESFSALRTDERLRIMREIVKRRCLPNGMEPAGLSQKLMEKPLSQWMQQEFGHIQGLTHKNAVRLLGRHEMLAPLIREMKNNAEARYVLDNPEQCRGACSMEEIREKALECSEWKYLADVFAFSEEFIEENQGRIRQFIFEDGAHIMKIYCESQQDRLDDLRRLVSAELMGRFKELKYYHDDLSQEIDYPVTEWQKRAWMENCREEQGELAVWEEDGLIPVMQMGVKPYNTCLSYIDGCYRQCLLACHDANKKVLYLSYRGKVVLRAAVRLTKGAYDKDTGNKHPRMHFADLMADEAGSSAGSVEAQEYLTLFLEHAYIAELPERLVRNACQLILCLLKRKAKAMNALLSASTSYQDFLDKELVPVWYFMYISKSKAGEQYLDSLGGNNCVDSEGSYKHGKFLMDRENA